ncbi:hypothetical protein L211DRAFT_840958, partial [Terfezia boudieri ATCC MYA-4762]
MSPLKKLAFGGFGRVLFYKQKWIPRELEDLDAKGLARKILQLGNSSWRWWLARCDMYDDRIITAFNDCIGHASL